MKYYTDIISVPLAEKLKEKGMPMDCGCNLCCLVPGNGDEEYTFGFVFDWLTSRGVPIYIRPCYLTNGDLGGWQPCYRIWAMKAEYTWHEAAEKAIEKALTLI